MIHMLYKIREEEAYGLKGVHKYVARKGYGMNVVLFRIVNDMYTTRKDSVELIFKTEEDQW